MGGYPCLMRPISLITPYKNRLRGVAQQRFNAHHARARSVIERAFGMMKTRSFSVPWRWMSHLCQMSLCVALCFTMYVWAMMMSYRWMRRTLKSPSGKRCPEEVPCETALQISCPHFSVFHRNKIIVDKNTDKSLKHHIHSTHLTYYIHSHKNDQGGWSLPEPGPSRGFFLHGSFPLSLLPLCLLDQRPIQSNIGPLLPLHLSPLPFDFEGLRPLHHLAHERHAVPPLTHSFLAPSRWLSHFLQA
ncbi:uncharacterized protein LOC124475677 [Hypomesus transpacificus]|uniref:uncharacterized protein LOC124475677 n=1 Tax=Hypomesus transpacificus TaxID=137520 RepID=UPI001F07BCB3|nr:uncharacterized protein LOC124475677 [Hypomesus transpacificus]